ncbi:PREDICTED: E3 ubiquitin-protein ligase parkin-like [Amphimedon queenslandica]|uniref:RING/Ubox-like zinc-binding domain-containing protein n=1 Tax=Amphimedon queenslandica TaxID=400682 RepID=A0A1X7VUB6_AMPQE|nr:PREDICTED: E3 ubiquitin-protein ligase parkin-like [Amphimedon queenslandica]|eukprot:XP_019853441.1 PREDICTED: E3 ubiquitin-protein ligase parkin-like [Amphimedon queenslandica]
MATASGPIGINIQFGKQRATLHVDKKTKLNAIIAKALKELNEEPQGRHFLLLHEGKPLPGDATAEAVFISKSATVFFLQPATELQIKTASQIQLDLKGANNAVEDNKYGYCKSCGSTCEVKPIFRCAGCNQETFILEGDIDYFDDESVLKAEGTCANPSCKGKGHPVITYVCKACPGDNQAPFLRQLRTNIHQLPCMKCEKKDMVVFLFSCNSKHTICFNCFHYYCTIMLDRNKFKNFGQAGFSIHCPGTDADCLDTPISDPHHFRIVEKTTDGKSFYNAFSDLAFEQWAPPGDNIICTNSNCKFEVDVSRGTDTEVTQPASASTPAPVVTGSAWMLFKKLFQGPPPPPPPPQMRKKVSCFKCQQAYCCVCKKNWHEGNCVIVDEKEIKEFTIDPKCAAASKWPQ